MYAHAVPATYVFIETLPQNNIIQYICNLCLASL